MLPYIRFVALVGLAFAVSLTCFGARASTSNLLLTAFLGLLLSILMVGLLVGLFVPANRRFRGWMLCTLGAIPLLILLVRTMMPFVSDQLFIRDLPGLNRVVGKIEKGTLRRCEYPMPLIDDDIAVAKAYRVEPRADGVLTISFFIGGCFPVKHLGYVYTADGKIPDDLKHYWPHGFRRGPKWFQVWD